MGLKKSAPPGHEPPDVPCTARTTPDKKLANQIAFPPNLTLKPYVAIISKFHMLKAETFQLVLAKTSVTKCLIARQVEIVGLCGREFRR